MNATNLPQQRETKWYERLTEQFAQLALSHPSVVSVYTGGTVSNPGISDLDFVLCLTNKLAEPLTIESQLTNELHVALSGGTILKVNEANMANIRIIDDFPLQHVAGSVFEFTGYTDELSEVCRILDWLPERLWSLKQKTKDGSTDVLWGLQFLKSLTVSLKKLDAAANTNHQDFCDDVQQLRDAWFEVPEHESLKSFWHTIAQAEGIIEAALEDLDAWLQDKSLIQYKDSGQATWHVTNGPALSSKTEVDTPFVTAPLSVLAFLSEQASFKTGFVSDQVRQSFGSTGPLKDSVIDPQLREVMLARMSYVESLATFFKANSLTTGLLKYGWFLYEPDSVKA